MKFVVEEYHRNTSNIDLIDDIKSVSLKLQKNTVTINEYNEYGKFNSSTLQRRFGSWFTVLELAGLEPSRSKINISDNDLFKNIENVWIILGRQPKYNEIKKPLSKYSAGTYEKRYGGWHNALKKFVDYIEFDDSNENINEEKNSQKNNDTKEIKHKTKREISDRLRFRILMRDGFTCKKCGRSPTKELGVELQVDHIIPWSKGGETLLENLETKCKKCNLGKGNEFTV
jgi:5-methylcytosine-specific restriction endonuclease McrA